MSDTLERTDLGEKTGLDHPWSTVVWDDPVNLMTYVTWVFRSYLALPEAQAEQLMLRVHFEGKATVASGPRESMERHVEALHDFGLWATVEKAGR